MSEEKWLYFSVFLFRTRACKPQRHLLLYQSPSKLIRPFVFELACIVSITRKYRKYRVNEYLKNKGELMMNFKIENRNIGEDSSVFIIAEVGVNHNGSIAIAKHMIDEVALTGVDCVKFQTFSAKEFCLDDNKTYSIQKNGKMSSVSMLEMFKERELPYQVFEELFSYARDKGLIPLSTPTDILAVSFLEKCKAGAYKVGSDDIVHVDLLDYIAKTNKPVILSTGMSTLTDIRRAANCILSDQDSKLAILHCVSLYPTPPSLVNLNKIKNLIQVFPEAVIGYSDHSIGNTACLGAVALGAKIIEKHFTLDKRMDGPDHWFSADINEMKDLVCAIRDIESKLGQGSFRISDEEASMSNIARRSIYSNCVIEVGDIITKDKICYKRPANGLMPFHNPLIVGHRAIRRLNCNDLILQGDVD